MPFLYDREFGIAPFDTVFSSEHITVIHTPIQAPNANAFAERWVRSVREECLDKLIIVNQAHLHRTMSEYVAYYNEKRPHQGIGQKAPMFSFPSNDKGPIRRRDVLGGIIHGYYRHTA